MHPIKKEMRMRSYRVIRQTALRVITVGVGVVLGLYLANLAADTFLHDGETLGIIASIIVNFSLIVFFGAIMCGIWWITRPITRYIEWLHEVGEHLKQQS